MAGALPLPSSPRLAMRTIRIKEMKYLLTGVGMVAALAISAPLWAQAVSPSGGNPMGTPGPNPGGPGLTPYSAGAPAPRTMAPPPPAAMAPSAMPPSSMSDTTSATPPRHSHVHSHAHTTHTHVHTMGTHHAGKSMSLSGSTANQLNQEELARLQAGNMSMPAAPPSPGMAPGMAPQGGSSGAGPR